MDYKRFRFWFMLSFCVNFLIGFSQLIFGYNHYIDHKWLLLGVSLILSTCNFVCAKVMYTRYKQVIQDEKDEVWRILSTNYEHQMETF